MTSWILIPAAAALATLGLLTVFRAPPWSPWKLAILAGEFGHWLALPSVLIAGAGWPAAPGPSGTTATLLGLLATGLFLKPAWQAARLARPLPARLREGFGDWTGDGYPAFTWRELFGAGEQTAAKPATMEFAPGLALDLYRPAQSGNGQAPCVIVIHGGGWDGGDRRQLPGLNHWLVKRGYAVAAISYRLAPSHRWPAQRDDALAAIAFLKARGPALGIDPARLVLLGRSAGGQIAQSVAYTARDPAIRGVVAFYAPSDLIFGYVNTHEDDMLRSPTLMRQLLGGPPDRERAAYESASPIFHVTRDAPPTLLLHGVNDSIAWHRHSERLAERLAANGVPHLNLLLPWATHAFDFNLRGPGGQLTRYALAWYLARVTEPKVNQTAPRQT
jgi:acetyl esterase/lipase